VCWGLLCEPVSWPGCLHHFCLLCTLRTRRHAKPTCPLCRSPAQRTRHVTALQIDGVRAARVRQLVGFSAYEAKRRELWAEAAKPPEELRATPLMCTKMKPRKWRAGTRLGVRYLEPRYQDMVRRAMAPGGNRRFAAVTQTCASSSENEVAVGARCRLCEIMESIEEDGACFVIIETGPACRVLSVTKNDICYDSLPLLIGDLEELEDGEDEEPEEMDEDGIEDGAVVLSESRRLELAQERLHVLEAMHAAMELEQARLEQRRLEYMMLLSQRRMLQELVDLSSQFTELAGVAEAIRREPAPSSGPSQRPIDVGRTSPAYGSSEPQHRARDFRVSLEEHRPHESQRANVARSTSHRLSQGVLASSGSVERFGRSSPAGRVSLDQLAPSMGWAGHARHLMATLSGPERSSIRRGHRSAAAVDMEQVPTQAETTRRRGGGIISATLATLGTVDLALDNLSPPRNGAATGARRPAMSSTSLRLEQHRGGRRAAR